MTTEIIYSVERMFWLHCKLVWVHEREISDSLRIDSIIVINDIHYYEYRFILMEIHFGHIGCGSAIWVLHFAFILSSDAGYTERFMGLDTEEDNAAGYNVNLLPIILFIYLSYTSTHI